MTIVLPPRFHFAIKSAWTGAADTARRTGCRAHFSFVSRRPVRTLTGVSPERLAHLNSVYRFDDGSIYIARRHAAPLEGQDSGKAPVELFTAADHERFAHVFDLVVGFAGAADPATTMRLRVGESERNAVGASELKSERSLTPESRLARRITAMSVTVTSAKGSCKSSFG